MMLKQNTRAKRWLAVGALILMLTVLLTACGGRTTTDNSLKTPETITKATYGNLESEELKKVADLLVAVQKTEAFEKFSVQDMLIAAKRGYDMTAEGFNDAQLPAAAPENMVVYAQNVLRKANGAAKTENMIDTAIIEKLNSADVDKLVEMFKVTVETDVNADSGIVDKIERGIGVVLRWITRYLGFNRYILGICVFAVLVEILLLPFAIKQQKNSIRQAKLRPKEMAIRNKYKGRNDQATQQKVQKEIQELYQRENYSPFSGCLPLLIQMPILIVLYNVVMDPLHFILGRSTEVSAALSSYYTAARAAGGMGGTLKHASGSIELLSRGVGDMLEGLESFEYFTNAPAVAEQLRNIQYPNFNIFGLNFGFVPDFEHWWLFFVPALTFVVYFFSMRLSRKFVPQPMQDGANDRQTACSNTMMDISMPAMSTFFAFALPAIVGVYWIFRSVLGTLKQFIMSRVMPLPKFTEEDYKAAAKELAGKAPKVEKSERVGTVRSLHHIDDEDFEDTRERAAKQKSALEEKSRTDQETMAEKSPFERSEIKEEREAPAQPEKKPLFGFFGKKKKSDENKAEGEAAKSDNGSSDAEQAPKAEDATVDPSGTQEPNDRT